MPHPSLCLELYRLSDRDGEIRDGSSNGTPLGSERNGGRKFSPVSSGIPLPPGWSLTRSQHHQSGGPVHVNACRLIENWKAVAQISSETWVRLGSTKSSQRVP